MGAFKEAFISYGRKESKAFAERIYHFLTQQGMEVWFDHVNIPKGDDFQQRIDHGIESAHHFLYIIAPHAISSPYCLKEVALAASLNKRIIPILHIEAPANDPVWQQLHPAIGRINWIYARQEAGDIADQAHWKDVDSFAEAMQDLVELMQVRRDYVEMHTQLLAKAAEWQRNNRSTSQLLVGQDRFDAEKWLLTEFVPPEQPPCHPTDLQAYFICESKKNAENLMTQAFIASSEKDDAAKEGVRRFLMLKGITSWVDSTDIRKGENYHEAIQRGIEQADNLLFLISPDSVVSPYCLKELEYAFELKKRIVPILLRDTNADDNPDELEYLQYIDARQALTDEHGIWHLPTRAEKELLQQLELDKRYYEQHKVLLVQALKWQRQAENPTILLMGFRLQNAQAWLRIGQKRAQHPPLPIHETFIGASTAHAGESNPDVFISYSRNDSDLARRFNSELQIHGKSTWFDQDSISETANFQEEIYKGIALSDNFLFLISPKSVASPFCADEVAYAASLGKRFITVLLAPVDPATLPPALATVQWIELRTDFSITFSQVIRALETDREYIAAHSRWQRKALEWQVENRDEDLLLRGSEFSVAELWLQEAKQQNRKPAPTSLQEEYLEASRSLMLAAQARDREIANTLRRRLFVSRISLGVAVILLFLAIGALWQSYQNAQKAKASQALAEANALEAENRRKEVEEQSKIVSLKSEEAELERNRALSALGEVSRAKTLVELREKEALEQKNLAEKRNQQLVEERSRTNRQVALALTYKGEKEIENNNLWYAAAFFEKSDSIEVEDPEIKRLTTNLVNSWKRSMVTPSDVVNLADINLAPVKIKQDATLYNQFLSPVRDEYPSDLAFFRYPDKVVHLKPGTRAEVQLLAEPIEGENFVYNDFADQLVELASDFTQIHIYTLTPEKKLLQSVPVRNGITHFFVRKDGEYLVIVNDGKQSIEVYSLEKQQFVYEGNMGGNFISLNFESRTLLVGLANGQLLTLDVEKSPVQLQKDRIFNNSINEIRISLDGRLRAYVASNEVVFQQVGTGERTQLNLQQRVVQCQFTPDSRYFVLADAAPEGNVLIYSVDQGVKVIKSIQLGAQLVKFAFEKTGRLIAFWLADNTIKINFFASNQSVTGIMQASGDLLDIGFIGNSFYEVTRSYQCVFRNLPALVTTETDYHPLVTHLPNTGYLLAAVQGKGLFAISDKPEKGEQVQEYLSSNLAFPLALKSSADESLMVLSSLDNKLYICNLAAGNVYTLPQNAFISTFETSPNSRWVGVGLADGYLLMYDLQEQTEALRYKFPDTHIRAMTFSPDNRYVALFFEEGNYMIVTLGDWLNKAEGKLFDQNYCLGSSPYSDFRTSLGSFSPDGKYFMVTGHNGKIILYETANFQVIKEYSMGNYQAYSSIWENNEYFYIGTYNGRVFRFSVANGRDRSINITLDASIRELDLVKEIGMLVVTDDEGRLWTFDNHYGQQLGMPYLFERPPTFLSYNPDDLSCMVDVPNRGLFKVYLFSKDELNISQMIGARIDDQHRVVEYLGENYSLQQRRNKQVGFRQNSEQVISFDQMQTTQISKKTDFLLGKWSGEGHDVPPYPNYDGSMWTFTLEITPGSGNRLKGKIFWTRSVQVEGDTTWQSTLYGEEWLDVDYEPNERIIRLTPYYVQSEFGLGSVNEYRAYLTADGKKIEKGLWGISGGFWGIWRAEKE